jgi:hypothetical protein
MINMEDKSIGNMTFEESREYIANQLQMQRNNLKIQQLQIEALEGQIETQKVAKEMAKKTAYTTQEDFDKELMLRVVTAIITSRKPSGTIDYMRDEFAGNNIIRNYYNAAKKGISVTLKDRKEKWYE